MMSLEMYINFISMNVSTVTGAALFICITSLLSYIIYAFSIREKSFEEVMEEQRKRNQQEELQQKQEKVKKEKEKKHKKWVKKVKEKTDQSIDPLKNDSLPPVNQQSQFTNDGDNEIEIIEPKESQQLKKKIKSSYQKQGNASSTQPPSKETAVSEKVQKGPLETNTPAKDEKKDKSFVKEEKKEKLPVSPKEVKKEKLPVSPKEVKKEKPERATVKDKEKSKSESPKGAESTKITDAESMQTETAAPVPSTSSAVKKKKKVEQSDKEERITASKLISLIKDTILDEEDNRMLIDILLNKQKEAPGWKRSGGDAQSGIKKQLREREASLEQELRQKQAASLKFQQDLAQEKSKALVAEQHLKEKISSQQQEIQNLINRVKITQDELTAEKNALTKANELEKSMQEKAAAALKKVQELMKTLKHLESETKVNNSNEEVEKLKNSKDNLQKAHALLVEQHTQIHSTHQSEMKKMNAQLADLNKNLEKYKEEKNAMLEELESWKNKSKDFEAVNATLKQEITGSSSKSDVDQLTVLLEKSQKQQLNLENELKEHSGQVDELTDQNKQLHGELTNLQNENERLSTELAATNERVAGDGQEMLHQNGEMDGKATEEQNVIIEKEKTLLEKEHTIQNLHVEVENLNTEIEQQKHRNNELRDKNWKTVEALKAAEKESVDRIGKLEEKLQQALSNTANSDRVKELFEKLQQTEQELHTLKIEINDNLQKYESVVKEKTHLNREIQKLQELKADLEIELNVSQQSENELEASKSKLDQEKKINKDFSSQMIKLNSLVKIEHDALRHEQELVKKLQSQLSEKQTEQAAIIEKDQLLLERENTIKQLSREVENLHKEIKLQTQKNNGLLEEAGKAEEALKTIEEKSKNEIHKLTEQLRLATENTADANRAKELSEKLQETQQKLQAAEKESHSNLQKYESICDENASLNSEFQQLQEMQENLNNNIASSEQLSKKLSREVSDQEVSYKQFLRKLVPSVSLDDNLPYNQWLSEFEKLAVQELQTASSLRKEVDELQAQLLKTGAEKSDLGAKVMGYTKTLAETDELLKTLTESAKRQESEFSERLRSKELELENVLEELKTIDKMKEELHCHIHQLEQVKTDKSTLQNTLNSLESEKTSLEQKFEEVNNNCINLKDQIDSKNNQIEKLQKEISSVENLKTELEVSKSKLDQEKKINKDFSSQMIKLNSLVKIGHDALRHEQELVKKLQSQLSEKLATANGTSSPTASTEAELPPKKLQTEKSKKSKKSVR